MKDLFKGFKEGCYDEDEEVIKDYWKDFIKWIKKILKCQTK